MEENVKLNKVEERIERFNMDGKVLEGGDILQEREWEVSVQQQEGVECVQKCLN